MDELPSDFSYKLIQHTDGEFVFRIKDVKDEKAVMIWLEKYSRKSLTTWRKSKTYPYSGRINIFKLDLHCSHFTDRRAQGKRSSKHTGCQAQMRIIIKRYVRRSRMKKVDPLTQNWPTLIRIKGVHNHVLNSAATLKYRDMCEETKQKLISLFHQGHSPSTALLCLKTDLLLEKGEEYYKVEIDRCYVPSISVVHKLYSKEFNAGYGDISRENMFENLKLHLENYSKSTSGVAKLFETSDQQHYYVVICTPIMLRAHEKAHQASEIVLLDAFGDVDKQHHRVYFFTTPTTAGCLPLGVIIMDCKEEYVFDEALKELKHIFPEDSFYKKQFPETFLADNDLIEMNPLQKHFPLSNILLCHFHILKSVWLWLCNKKQRIKSWDRQDLYFLFKKVLYAQNEIELEITYDALISSEVYKLYPKFTEHFTNLWAVKEYWALCFRQELDLGGSVSTNYVEVVFRIMNDYILGKIIAFNLMQLVDYILSRYEMYIEKRLTYFFYGCCPKALLQNMLMGKGTNSITNIKQIPGLDGVFSAIGNDSGMEYTIDVLGGVCSCLVGQTGKLCKHAAGIVLSIAEEVNSSFNMASSKTKEVMFYIATGNQPPQDLFQPLDCDPCSEIFQNSVEIKIDNEEPNTILSFSEDTNFLQDIPKLSIKLSLTTEDIEDFRNLVERIENGVETNSDVFVPAVKQMLANARNFVTTEADLVSALNTFGTHKVLQSKLTKVNRSKNIRVQPTVRKYRLIMKKCEPSECPQESTKIPPS